MDLHLPRHSTKLRPSPAPLTRPDRQKESKREEKSETEGGAGDVRREGRKRRKTTCVCFSEAGWWGGRDDLGETSRRSLQALFCCMCLYVHVHTTPIHAIHSLHVLTCGPTRRQSTNLHVRVCTPRDVRTRVCLRTSPRDRLGLQVVSVMKRTEEKKKKKKKSPHLVSQSDGM